MSRIWGLTLALLLAVSAAYGWVRWSGIPDIAWGCDQFAHLVMTKQIRRAWTQGRRPDFTFSSPQGRELIEFMKSSGAPVEQWHEMVAPHGHRYVALTDQVIDQYSPGTGLVLSLFPDRRATGCVTRITLVTLLLLGAGALAWRARAGGSLVPAAWAALGAFQGMYTLIRFGLGNYSLYVIVLPTVASAFFCAWSWSLSNRGDRRSGLAALAGGALTGFSCFIRIPGVLGIPGFLLLLKRRDWPWFLAGGFVFGFVPQAWYQHLATGHFWASTYDTVNVSAPVLKAIPHYIRFYLLKGLGAPFFIVPAIAFSAYFTLRAWKHWRTLGRASLVSWGLPAVYFLTHVPAVQYYMCPAHLAAVGLLAWGVFFEYREKDPARGKAWLRLAPAAALLLALPFAWAFVSGSRVAMDLPWNESLFFAERIPTDLRKKDAWIWSDVTNGAFWYYGDKPAFNIAFGGSPELRRKVFTWAAARGDQYLVMDGGGSQIVAKELEASGAKLEPRGEVFGQKYFKITLSRQQPGEAACGFAKGEVPWVYITPKP